MATAAPLARAQEADGAQPAVSAALFSTLDRTDDASKLGVSTGLSLGDGEGFGLRTDLFGQYMDPRGVGGFVSLPVSMISDVEDITALGNVELGGVFHVKPTDAVSVLFRGGLMLPTASEDGFFAGLAAGFGRLTDFAAIVPEVTTLRLSASPIIRQGSLFARADIGFDLPVSETDDLEPLLRANVGLGAVSDRVSAAVELVSMRLPDSEFIHTAAFTARYLGSAVQPGLSLVTPMDEGFRGELFVVMADVVVPLAR